MKALVLEDPVREYWTKKIFEYAGIETTTKFVEGEKYDFCYKHYKGPQDFKFIDALRKKQPKCFMIGYSSIPSRDAPLDSPNKALEDLMRKHFDDIMYYDEMPEDVIKRILGNGEPAD